MKMLLTTSYALHVARRYAARRHAMEVLDSEATGLEMFTKVAISGPAGDRQQRIVAVQLGRGVDWGYVNRTS